MEGDEDADDGADALAWDEVLEELAVLGVTMSCQRVPLAWRMLPGLKLRMLRECRGAWGAPSCTHAAMVGDLRAAGLLNGLESSCCCAAFWIFNTALTEVKKLGHKGLDGANF